MKSSSRDRRLVTADLPSAFHHSGRLRVVDNAASPIRSEFDIGRHSMCLADLHLMFAALFDKRHLRRQVVRDLVAVMFEIGGQTMLTFIFVLPTASPVMKDTTGVEAVRQRYCFTIPQHDYRSPGTRKNLCQTVGLFGSVEQSTN